MIGYVWSFLGGCDIKELIDDIFHESFKLSEDYFNKLKKIKSKKRKRKGKR